MHNLRQLALCARRTSHRLQFAVVPFPARPRPTCGEFLWMNLPAVAVDTDPDYSRFGRTRRRGVVAELVRVPTQVSRRS